MTGVQTCALPISFKDLRKTGVVEKLKTVRDKKLKDELSIK